MPIPLLSQRVVSWIDPDIAPILGVCCLLSLLLLLILVYCTYNTMAKLYMHNGIRQN